MPVVRYTGPNGTVAPFLPDFPSLEQIEKEAEREWWMAPTAVWASGGIDEG